MSQTMPRSIADLRETVLDALKRAKVKGKR
jgi:hypothetical protein